MRDTDILNPGSSLEVIRLRNGHWIMVYNDLERNRYSLVAAISEDEGKTWPIRRHLEGQPDVETPGQYHYPSVMQARDDAIHVTYSYFTPAGKSIKHARLTEEWLRNKPQ
jgi:predicted neuraminidase